MIGQFECCVVGGGECWISELRHRLCDRGCVHKMYMILDSKGFGKIDFRELFGLLDSLRDACIEFEFYLSDRDECMDLSKYGVVYKIKQDTLSFWKKFNLLS